MKTPRLRFSEQSQVALILFFALGGLFSIWYFLLLPQHRMREEIESLRSQLKASKYYQQSAASLRQAAEQELARAARLQTEWTMTAERLATFANQAALRRSDPGRIDYQFELFRTRKSLTEKSETLGIRLIPTDLGIDDPLTEKDKVRERMLQLKTVERLADLTLDRRIDRLIAIRPDPPRTHKDAGGKPLFDEYPVRVEFDVAFDNLYLLFQSVFEENRIFVFRNLRIEAGPKAQSPVRVKAVMSALVFE